MPDPHNPHFNPDDLTQEVENDDLARIKDLLAGLDLTSATCRIYRQAPGTADFVYEDEIQLDSFSLNLIRDNYGGGRYKLQFCDGGKYVKTVKIAIRDSIKGLKTSPPEPPPAAALPTNPTDPAFLMALMKQQQDQAERIAAQQREDSRNFMALMMQTMNASQQSMTQMVAALAGGGRSQGNDRIVEILLPSLLQKPSGSLLETLEVFQKVKQLTGGECAAEPAEPAEEDMIDKFSKIAPLLQTGINAIGALASRPQAPVPNPVQQAIPVGPSAAGPSPDDILAREKLATIRGQLSMALPFLVTAAKEDKPVQPYVEQLRSLVDAETLAILTQILAREDWMTILFQNPPPTPTHGWFQRLRNALIGAPDAPTAEAEEVQGPLQPLPGRRGSTLDRPR